MNLAVITSKEITYFIGFLLFVVLGLAASLFYNWWMSAKEISLSPYTSLPLRRGSDLHPTVVEKVLRYLFDMHDYYNRMFDWNNAAYCRDTGRIFPNVKTWYGAYRVDWTFIRKRQPGTFVSWGSLTEEQKLLMIDRHVSLEGFQTEFSSRNPLPEKVEPEYAYRKPGPLYVDISTGVLMGWKCVPDTELEVLIIQRPIEKYLPGIHKKY